MIAERTHVRAVGSFSGRADDLINLRGIKTILFKLRRLFARSRIGDEYEVVLSTNAEGLDIMSVRVEHEMDVGAAIQDAVRTSCEIRSDVEILAPGTLHKLNSSKARA